MIIQSRASISTVTVHTFNEVVELGRKTPPIKTYRSPVLIDLAVIMYTSGSTGLPKGVMMTHGNVLSSLYSARKRFEFGSYPTNHIYIGYLPLAHVLELTVEIGMILGGVAVGYSSPFTLTDNSTAVKTGEIGDLRTLKPTLMASVPLVLERLKKAVEEKVALEASALKKNLFEAACAKKLKLVKQGKSTTVLDMLVFKKINQAVLGGRFLIYFI